MSKVCYQNWNRKLFPLRIVLKVLPIERLNWQPHEKAMTLGQLALHVATIPGRNLTFASNGEVEADVIVQHPIPSSKEEVTVF